MQDRERSAELENVINNKDYNKVLAEFNNKGLKIIANKYFKIPDFVDLAIKLPQFQPELINF